MKSSVNGKEGLLTIRRRTSNESDMHTRLNENLIGVNNLLLDLIKISKLARFSHFFFVGVQQLLATAIITSFSRHVGAV